MPHWQGNFLSYELSLPKVEKNPQTPRESLIMWECGVAVVDKLQREVVK